MYRQQEELIIPSGYQESVSPLIAVAKYGPRSPHSGGAMQQISHIEVRRHPIWQQEVHNEHLVARPNGAISPRGRLILATVFGMAVVATLLIVNG